MTTPTRRFMRSPTFAYVALVTVLFAGVYFTQRNYASDTRASQLAGCERGKADRADQARVFTAQANYWWGVLQAKSVKRDVKDQVRIVRREAVRAALGVRSRILECVALIDDHHPIPDRTVLGTLPPAPSP